MQTLNRDQLKKLFKKVKHLHLPPDLEQVDFTELTYYSWLDQSEMVLYVVYDFHQNSTGLRLEIIRPPAGALRLGFCEFCHKHRRQAEVLFVACETKHRPKGVEYQSRGTWMCADFTKCNQNIKSTTKLDQFFSAILEKE